MAGKQAAEPRWFNAVEIMISGDNDKADIGENCGFGVWAALTPVGDRAL